MLNVVFRRAARLACAWALWAPTAHAVETPSPEQAASAPFKNYQGWRDEPLQDWRTVNDRVGEIGGWRTYLRESQPPGDGADQDRQGHDGHQGH
jgi:hypothetical protein